MAEELKVEVSNKQGIHARPSSMIVKAAMGFECDISIENLREEIEVNAKKILEVMTLTAGYGCPLMLRAEGSDAKEAIAALAELLQSGFGED